MPFAHIEVRLARTPEEETAIVDAVHESLVDAFAIPPEDKHVRLVVHEPHRFAVSPRLARPELATLVTIDCFAGRSAEAKRRLYAGIVERLERLDIPRDHVSTTVRESALHNWGVSGGQSAADVDLGFEVRV